MDDYERLLMTAGIRPMPVEEAKAGLRTENAPLFGGAVISFPRRQAQAEERAAALIGAHAPAALIAVEADGETGDRRLLTYRGDDAAPAMPYMLFRAAGDAITIGIGDGGNELGFGAIPKAAAVALCGDEKETGRAPATEVQHVLPAAVSNWGAYALLAAMAVALRRAAAHPPAGTRAQASGARPRPRVH